MKPSPKTKELQHVGVQQNFMFNQCEGGGYLRGGGGGGGGEEVVSTCVYC